MCVCVCVCVQERERERVCMYVCVSMCIHACMRVCMVRESVCASTINTRLTKTPQPPCVLPARTAWPGK